MCNEPETARLVKRLVDKIESARHEIADYEIITPDASQVFIAYGAPVRTVQQVMHDNRDKDIGFLRFVLSGRFLKRHLPVEMPGISLSRR